MLAGVLVFLKLPAATASCLSKRLPLQVLLSRYNASDAGASAAAAKSPPSAVVDKRDFSRALSKLRRQWAEEAAQKKRLQAAARAAEREAALANKRAKQLQQQLSRKEKAEERAKEEGFRQIISAAKVKQGQAWREAVGAIYEEQLENRVFRLVEQSRHWIRSQDLEARINEALDNPVDLFDDEQGLHTTPEREEVFALTDQALQRETARDGAGAESLYKEALSKFPLAAILEDDQLENTFKWLILFYQDQGAYDKARSLLEEAVAVREADVGPSDKSDIALKIEYYQDLLAKLPRARH